MFKFNLIYSSIWYFIYVAFHLIKRFYRGEPRRGKISNNEWLHLTSTQKTK